MNSASSLSPATRRRIIVATTIGNALEFFDFTVYSFVGVLISKLFFPSATPAGQLLLVAATFGVGFIMRPVGGLVIGIYSDRAGRKAGLLLTIALMALGCLIIGLAPTYAQVGVLSPILIVFARLLQGFSAGGEVGASSAMMLESAEPSKRGYYASWQFASSSLGVMLGALVTGALTFSLTPVQFESWGWRLPFLLGALIAPVGWYIRREIEETLGSSGEAEVKRVKNPLADVLREYMGPALRGILLVGGGITTSYTVTFFIPTYAIKQLGLPPSVALAAAVLCGFTGLVVAPLVGIASDRFGRKPIIVWARIASLLAIFPCFLWLNAEPSTARLFPVMILLGILLAVQMTPIITMVVEIFPQHIRVTGMSVVYGIGVSFIGGFAQFINTWLVSVTHSNLAPAWYLSGILIVSSLALIGFKDRTHDHL